MELCTNEEFKTQYDNDHYTRAHYLQKTITTLATNTTTWPATADSQGYQRMWRLGRWVIFIYLSLIAQIWQKARKILVPCRGRFVLCVMFRLFGLQFTQHWTWRRFIFFEIMFSIRTRARNWIIVQWCCISVGSEFCHVLRALHILDSYILIPLELHSDTSCMQVCSPLSYVIMCSNFLNS